MRVPHYTHYQAAHCENGATINLLRHKGFGEITESIQFGISSGLFFIHEPLLKIKGLPLTMCRIPTGRIFCNTVKALGAKYRVRRFLSKKNAERELDKLLEAGTAVGLIVSLKSLPYFPDKMRTELAEFSCHSIVVIGKEGNDYIVSDTYPGVDGIHQISAESLMEARFVKGLLNPFGEMYYVTQVSDQYNIKECIRKGIQKTCRLMLNLPTRRFGIAGELFLADEMRKIKSKSLDEQRPWVRNIIRITEEGGSGGAGFRYIYARFLQEAEDYFPNQGLLQMAEKMKSIADLWQYYAVDILRVSKQRGEIKTIDELADEMVQIAEEEKKFFTELREIQLK